MSPASSQVAPGTPSGPGPRRRHREFLELLSGQTVSDAGSQATTVALPLLALVLTHSPLQAGLIGFARSLAYPLAAIPSGLAADRYDRRALLLVAAGVRTLAMVSVLLVLALDRPPLLQLILVGFVDSAMWSLGLAAERSALPQLVGAGELPAAVALGEGSNAAAAIAGPPAGGVLFAIAQGLPFAFDAVSSLPLVAAVLNIRTPLQEADHEREPEVGAIAHAVEGMRWLWRRPFFRAGSLLYAGANVCWAGLELLVLLLARHYGAESGQVGVMFAVIGAGGVLGALLAQRAVARVPAAVSVALEPWLLLLLTPLLLLVHQALLIGVVGGLIFVAAPLNVATIVGRRIAQTPDHLRGRVQAAAGLLASSLAWIGPLGVGAIFGRWGPAAATLGLTGCALLLVIGVSASASLRHPPDG